MRVSTFFAAAGMSVMGMSLTGMSVVGLGSAYAAGGGPSGEWVVQDQSAIVRISKCGGNFCGFVAKGQAGKDYRNPDPRKRGRSVIGIQVMFSMKQSGPASWSGETYNADDGQIYNGKITLAGPNSLQVQGCVPGGGVCGSQTWSRAN